MATRRPILSVVIAVVGVWLLLAAVAPEQSFVVGKASTLHGAASQPVLVESKVVRQAEKKKMSPQSSPPMDSSDLAYLRQLAALQRIREYAAGLELRLPQIVVVGDQSSGKSSLLTRLTGVEFPVNSGICTKAPIVLACRNDVAKRADEYALFDAKTEQYRSCDLVALAQEIKHVQNQALLKLDAKISEEEILVQVTGPSQMDVVVVDLPGIVNTGEGVAETRRLIEKYIKNPETLILLVSEAKQDDELVTARELAFKYDPQGGRTKRILTKFDTFDSEDAKRRAVGLINEAERDEPDASGSPASRGHRESTASSKDAGCALRAHAVITAPGGEALAYTPEVESELLVAAGVTREAAAGVRALKRLLPDIYAELIRTNLPALSESVQQRADKARNQLRVIGEDPADGNLMIKACQEALLDNVIELEQGLTAALLKFQESVQETETQLQKEWSDAKLQPNSFVCTVFLGEDAMKRCMADIVLWWRPILKDLQDEVSNSLKRAVQDKLQGTLGSGASPATCYVNVPDHLVEAVARQWAKYIAEVLRKFETACEKILLREIDFGTMHIYLSAKYAGDRIFPDTAVDAVVEAVRKDWMDSRGSSDDSLQNVVQKLRSRISDQKTLYEKNFQAMTLHQQQQDRLFDAVKALWTVEHKTFIDLVLKELRATGLDAYKDWVNRELWTDREIRENAAENASDARKRTLLKEQLEKMEWCSAELKKLSQ